MRQGSLEEDRHHLFILHIPEIAVKTEVLIAEANSTLRSAYERKLTESGVQVETAADGLDCWTKLRAHSPVALMVDVDLLWGGSDGVLARLREDSDGLANPEVFVTGNDPPGVLSKRVGIEIERCFQKPIEISTVLHSICDVITCDAERRHIRGIGFDTERESFERKTVWNMSPHIVGDAICIPNDVETTIVS